MSIVSLNEKETDYFLRIGKITAEEAKELLNELGRECGSVVYEEDYAWINKAIIRWETYLKSEYDEVYLTPIVPPKQHLKRLLPDTEAFFWPLRRPLTELFAHFLVTEPSSDKVAIAFSNLILRLSEGVSTFDNERRETIKELTKIASVVRPYPCRQLAKFVEANVDDISRLKAFLKEFVDMQLSLPKKIRGVFASGLERLGIVSGSKILIYGYSELMQPALEAIPDALRKRIKIFVCECRHACHRGVGPLAERMAKDLNFPTTEVRDEEVPNIIIREKPTNLLIGCRSIGRNGTGSLEAINLEGSRKLAELASSNNVKVCIILGTRKIFGRELFHQRRLPWRSDILPTIVTISSIWAEFEEGVIPRNEKIPADYATFLITEDDIFTVNEFAGKYKHELSVGAFPLTE